MNIFRFLGSFVRRVRSGTTIDPVRDWLVLLILSTMILASSIVWNVWAFDTVANGGAIGTPTTKTPIVFSQASLETIRVIFENRATEEARYATGVYRFTDPSQ